MKKPSVWYRQYWWIVAVKKAQYQHESSLMLCERNRNEAMQRIAQAEANCARIKLWADEAVKSNQG